MGDMPPENVKFYMQIVHFGASLGGIVLLEDTLAPLFLLGRLSPAVIDASADDFIHSCERSESNKPTPT